LRVAENSQLAAVQAAICVTKSKLSEQRIVLFGAGSAGLGIARQIRDAAVILDGVSFEEASKMFFLVDKYGLLKEGIKGKIRSGMPKEFIWPNHDSEEIGNWPEGETQLLDVMRRAKPTIIIGTSTKAGAFTEDVCTEMAKHTERPIIMPVSSDTSRAGYLLILIDDSF
jgi:malate dehydrogenase (oxaloacetate-decarboxylating)